MSGCLLLAALVRRFSPETLINGFMSKDKAEEVAPTIFKKEKEDQQDKSNDSQ